MATGSSTGTPATGAGSSTLNSLRDRVRTQIENASGFTEPLAVSASSIQLATGTPNLRDRVEARLQDSGNSRWSTSDLDEAIRAALEQYSRYTPDSAITTVEVSAAGRELDISSISGLTRVDKVWWDYDSDSPGYPPNWRQFEVWPGSILYIDDRDAPEVGDIVRIWYTKPHTIKGLDSAAATTVPEEDLTYLISGACYFAARSRAVELSETLTVDRSVVDRLLEWADEEGKNFRYGARQNQPAWQRYASAYAQGDIDEAIRWALHRYSLVKPATAVASLTLSEDGREVDISSVTGLLDVLRVWWPYDSDDPEYPPQWRDFDVWPGNILYIHDGDEPATGDVVRLWYTTTQTLNGLDGAATTTFPDSDETLIVVGASGFCTQERVQERPGYFVPTKLREWAETRLREFERGLKQISRQRAARHSGLAAAAPLDRFDSDGESWR